MRNLFFGLLAISFGFGAWACDGSGIVKNNSLKIPPFSRLANTMTEADFNSTVKKFETYFGPRVENSTDHELVIFKSWSSSTVNAFAEQEDGKYLITIFGGFARYPGMTNDSLTLTLCHELGHHLGGYPKKTENKWSSAEGQADYFATSKCLRKIWELDNNQLVIQNASVPALVINQCKMTFSDAADLALCARMNLAAKAIAGVFQSLDMNSVEPQFETPDASVVSFMQYLYPTAQCRLDTYFQGSVCRVSKDIDFDHDDQTIGACHAKWGDTRGLRPACWFAARASMNQIE